MTRPTKAIVCCASHDHANSPECEFKTKEAVVELTDEEIAESDRQAKFYAEEEAKRQEEAKRAVALKESARAKLVTGQPLTEEEAATIVL